MVGRLVRFAIGALGVVAVLPSLGSGQRVLGPGDDAVVLPRGTMVIRGVADWRFANELYGPNGLEGIGARWTLDSLGAAQLPVLRPLQQGLRELSGLSAVSVSLGQTVTKVNNRISAFPIGVSVGLSKRLTVGLTVPLVQTASNVFFSGSPGTNKGNVAFNPALGDVDAFNADTAFISQVRRAAAAVSAFCGGAGAGNPQCVNGAGLAAEAATFADGLGRVYPNGLFVPLTGSDIQQAVDNRAALYRTGLNAFADVPGSGVTAVAETGVRGAALPLSTNDLQGIVMFPSLGVGADSIASMRRWELGDIELDAKFLLFNSVPMVQGAGGPTSSLAELSGVHARLSVGGMLRLPTGRAPSADQFFDVTAGNNAMAFGVRGYADLLVGPQFWTSIVARYDMNVASDQIMRVSDTPTQVFLSSFRKMNVNRKVGNALELEVTPRWVLNDFMSLSVQYAIRNKAEDRYTGSVVTVGPDSLTGDETVTINPSTLGLETAYTAQRIGGGFSFSSVRAYQQGKARIPFEVMYMRSQTITANGGYAPKQLTDRIEVRVYWRLFGN